MFTIIASTNYKAILKFILVELFSMVKLTVKNISNN